MIVDQLVSFLPPGSNLAITNASRRSNILDLLGIGVGVTPAQGNLIIGNRTLFGEDAGLGGVKPQVQCVVGTAFSGGTSLQVLFQGAEDDGTGNPDTWTTLIETPAIVTASLVANFVFGRFDFPPAAPVDFQPRFLSLYFVPVGTFAAGTVANAVVTMGRPDQANKYAPGNFVVAG